MKRIILSSLLIIFLLNNLNAQSPNSKLTYPEVGKPCPDFVLKNVVNYPKKQVSLNDFKGKWVILDFWDKDCAACIESFPKL